MFPKVAFQIENFRLTYRKLKSRKTFNVKIFPKANRYPYHHQSENSNLVLSDCWNFQFNLLKTENYYNPFRKVLSYFFIFLALFFISPLFLSFSYFSDGWGIFIIPFSPIFLPFPTFRMSRGNFPSPYIRFCILRLLEVNFDFKYLQSKIEAEVL